MVTFTKPPFFVKVVWKYFQFKKNIFANLPLQNFRRSKISVNLVNLRFECVKFSLEAWLKVPRQNASDFFHHFLLFPTAETIRTLINKKVDLEKLSMFVLLALNYHSAVDSNQSQPLHAQTDLCANRLAYHILFNLF